MFFCLYIVFTVPMRNWNNTYEIVRYSEIISFYSTYEELKLLFILQPPIFYLGFYSTYEELKPEKSTPIFCQSKCFYSTYEELKRLYSKYLYNLPNWFLQYLWGIETYSQQFNGKFLKSVFTVPMRNWNPK